MSSSGWSYTIARPKRGHAAIVEIRQGEGGAAGCCCGGPNRSRRPPAHAYRFGGHQAAKRRGEPILRFLVQAAYDNDGNIDIFVMSGAWLGPVGRKQVNSLLRNDGHGHFRDVTFEARLGDVHYPPKPPRGLTTTTTAISICTWEPKATHANFFTTTAMARSRMWPREPVSRTAASPRA